MRRVVDSRSLVAQYVSQSVLRQTMSIERRGIEEADAATVGCLQRRQRPLPRYSLVEITERSATQSQNADLQIGPANAPLLNPVHCPPLLTFVSMAVVSKAVKDHAFGVPSGFCRLAKTNRVVAIQSSPPRTSKLPTSQVDPIQAVKGSCLAASQYP